MQWSGKKAAFFLDPCKHFRRIYFYLFSSQTLTNEALSVILYLMNADKLSKTINGTIALLFILTMIMGMFS